MFDDNYSITNVRGELASLGYKLFAMRAQFVDLTNDTYEELHVDSCSCYSAC
jgi:hypothetical protein